MQAANDNTLSRLQLEINRAIFEQNSSQLIKYIARYMHASNMSVSEGLVKTIPTHSEEKQISFYKAK